MAIKELKLDLTPHLRKAELYAKRNVLSKTIEGSWVTTFKGRGIEFAGYRAYQYGDDASTIDWRASLRSKEPLVREFEEYKSFSVFILLDVSNSMLFSSTEKLKCEYAAEMAYSLAEGILRGGDAVGMGLFTNEITRAIYPDIGHGMLEKISKELKNPENYGGKFDLRKVLKQTQSYLKSNAVIIIISDFIGLEEGWERYVRMTSQHFDLIAVMTKDQRDRVLPRGTGQYTLRDPYTDKDLYIDVNHYADEYEKRVIEEEAHIKRVFESIKGGCVLIRTDKEYEEPLTRFMRRRQFITMTT